MTTIQIEIKDVGAIRHLQIALPEEGGVVRLLGPNGSGKSTALEAVSARLRGDGKGLEPRDGVKSGFVRVGHALITVGRSNRLSGQLEAVHLEDRFSIDKLVDPGVKDPDAADRQRIKALVCLSAQDGWEAAFRGDEALGILSLPQKASDPVEFARLAKEEAFSAARGYETVAMESAAKAKALRESFPERPVEVAGDEEAARKQLEDAIRRHASMVELEKRAKEQSGKRLESRVAFDDAVASYDGPTSSDAAKSLAEIKRQWEEARAMIAQCEKDLLLAESDLAAAKRHEASVDTLKKILNEEPIPYPSEEELSKADHAVKAAQAACENVSLARKAIAAHAEADSMEENAKGASKAAADYRAAAAHCDAVLGSLIQCEELRVKDGRLVADHARGEVPFADLSEGERWAIALKIATNRVGRGGIVVIPQEAWEGLDARNRAMVETLAKELHACVLTAEAYSDEADYQNEIAVA